MFGLPRMRRTQVRTSNGAVGSILTPLDQDPPTAEEIDAWALLLYAAKEDASVLEDPSHTVPALLGEKPRICRVCGCGTYNACQGGCWWVEYDLCSSCVGGGSVRAV